MKFNRNHWAQLPVIACWMVVISADQFVVAGDWPTFRGDAQRRGVGDEAINPMLLGEAWTLRSDGLPQTAWAGPAKWDAYAGIRGLRAMRDYDAAFGVAVAGSSVFVASSSDDSVTCVDLRTGKVRWRFWADAAVRITPTVENGRVYFGSDDGCAYCVDASDGKPIWKFRPPINEPLVLHNGRMISRWPCRTGVLIKDDRAFCGFSMLPWDPSFVCAIDAKTGKADGAGCFVQKFNGATIEGAMAASDGLLVAPQGRIPPRLFDLSTGKSLGALAGGGGSFVMVAPGQHICHGPGNKTGWVTRSDPKTRKHVATYKGFNSSVIGPLGDYRLSDDHVTAFDRKNMKMMWRMKVARTHALLLNRDTVFVGCRDEVVALDAATGKQVWSGQVDGDAYLLAVANESLLVSTDAGVVHCFRHGVPTAFASPEERDTAPKPTPPTIRATAPVSPSRPRSLKMPGLVGRWAFHTGMNDRARRRGLPDADRRVLDLAGDVHGTIQGEVNLRQAGGIEALALDGQRNSVVLAKNHSTVKLPGREITAEAWVRIDKPLDWGGIIGAMQDNGTFERGWILGYKGSRFCFALNGKGGEDKLTYLEGTTQFKPETWYHVVGTYDGKTQKLFVNGVLENSSTEQNGDIHYPPQAFYEIGAYHDKDENFRITGLVHEVRVYERSLSRDEIRVNRQTKQRDLPKPILLAAGPYVRFVDRETAEFVWHTGDPAPSKLILGKGNDARYVTDMLPKTEHVLRIGGLKHNRVDPYRISTGQGGLSPEFELDTTFNFTRAAAPDRPNPFGKGDDGGDADRAAKDVLKQFQVKAGICLVLAAGDGRLIYELVRRSDMIVIGVDTDAARVSAARAALTRAGVYGTRATVRHVESLDRIPYIGDFANLVVCGNLQHETTIASTSKEVLRLLRPDGGMALVGQTVGASKPIEADALRKWCGTAAHKIVQRSSGVWARISRGAISGAGEWSHLYGRADNSAYGGEHLKGARGAEDLRVQWLGRPGPRAQPDRNGRKPSPLSVGGRLFVQGLHRLIALDQYNGTILWSLEIPPMQRFNVPRDSSNWCADDKHVFVAVKDACWKIDAQTGKVESITTVKAPIRSEWKYDWSYIAREQDKLIGSAAKSGSVFVEFWGKADAGWYDARSGPATFKVCSDQLFALDESTGRHAWSYARGVVLNSTISVADDQVFFVECRHPKVVASESRRVGLPELWQDLHLVAIDLHSGSVKWQQPLKTAGGIVTYHMSHGEGVLAIAASNNKKFDVYTFDSASGKPLWQRDIGWLGGKGDHGKAMSRPAIASGRLFVRPEVLDLRSGKTLAKMPQGGCGTYALTAHSAIFRRGNVTLWNADTGASTSWERLRPGCWLSTIPAGGMLLSPEAGGGCSCGKWIETSIGFMPVNVDKN